MAAYALFLVCLEPVQDGEWSYEQQPSDVRAKHSPDFIRSAQWAVMIIKNFIQKINKSTQ